MEGDYLRFDAMFATIVLMPVTATNSPRTSEIDLEIPMSAT